MNIIEYAPLALRTAKRMPTMYMDRWHAAVGMTTEIGETYDAYKRHEIYGKPLDSVNVLEELGDYAWYLNLHMSLTGVVLEKLTGNGDADGTFKVPTDAHRLLLSLGAITSNVLMDTGIPQDENYLENNQTLCGEALFAVARLAELNGSSLSQVLQTNIDKLAARYGDKYSDYKALNRDAVAERAVLDGRTDGRVVSSAPNLQQVPKGTDPAAGLFGVLEDSDGTANN